VKPIMMMIEKKNSSFDDKIEKDTLFENMIYEWMDAQCSDHILILIKDNNSF